MRFYLHLLDDLDVPDSEGIELPDLVAARANAVQQARGLIGEIVKTEARIVLSNRIDIEDADGNVLETVHFRDVVTIIN